VIAIDHIDHDHERDHLQVHISSLIVTLGALWRRALGQNALLRHC
jgi:hypothetical protein